MASKWKTMRPETARSLAIMVTAAGTAWSLRTYDPGAWKPLGAILAYWWAIIPAWIVYVVIEIQLMRWLGATTEEGKPEVYVDPVERRLDNIEAAINRLHRYAQGLDPELKEEFELEREFMSGTGGMFAGMNHFQYVRDRENAGKRTIRGHNIWRDETPIDEEG
ncbi:hypothetical protein [Sphingomonas sp. TDK1]|uniref:hypothetical protein n=1 Tax=Sphingomonas sp. TDK1 TaxID=453247 RepID=UPI000AA2A5A3|nr:hypothetical protein [Sphingomonas sp. TDK1]